MPKTFGSVRQKALVVFFGKCSGAAALTQAIHAKKLRRYQSFVVTVESGQRRIDVEEFLD